MAQTGMKTVTDVTIVVVADGDATIAVANVGGRLHTASSKREPGDKNNPAIGTDLAVARLLETIARRMKRRANGAVRHAEWVKRERARRKETINEFHVTTGLTGAWSGAENDTLQRRRRELISHLRNHPDHRDNYLIDVVDMPTVDIIAEHGRQHGSGRHEKAPNV